MSKSSKFTAPMLRNKDTIMYSKISYNKWKFYLIFPVNLNDIPMAEILKTFILKMT